MTMAWRAPAKHKHKPRQLRPAVAGSMQKMHRHSCNAMQSSLRTRHDDPLRECKCLMPGSQYSDVSGLN